MTEIKIPIENIRTLENVRVETVNEGRDKDLEDLMSSIKQHGLLNLPGVWQEDGVFYILHGHRRIKACQKLGWQDIPVTLLSKPENDEDYALKSAAENLIRKELSPVELAEVCRWLEKKGYTQQEMAVRLSIPFSRVKNSLRLEQRVPDEYKKDLAFSPRKSKKAKISVRAANMITSTKFIRSKDRKKMFELAKRGIGYRDIDVLLRLLSAGLSFEDAFAKSKDYTPQQPTLVFHKKTFEKYDMGATALVRGIISGQIPPNKKLVFIPPKTNKQNKAPKKQKRYKQEAEKYRKKLEKTLEVLGETPMLPPREKR